MKKIYLIIFLLTVSIIFEGCSIKTQKNVNTGNKKAQAPLMDTLADCKKIADSNFKEICYVTIATEKKDIKICDDYLKDWRKGQCYSNVSSTLNDISICHKIEDWQNKNNCYLSYALKNNNLSVCDLTKDKESCYVQVAKNLKDISICNKLSNKKDNCIQEVVKITKNNNLCEHFDVDSKNWISCSIETNADNLPDDFCGTYYEEVGDLGLPNSEYSYCVSKLAIGKKKAELCKMISPLEHTLIEKCYTGIAKVLNNSKICNEITSAIDRPKYAEGLMLLCKSSILFTDEDIIQLYSEMEQKGFTSESEYNKYLKEKIDKIEKNK